MASASQNLLRLAALRQRNLSGEYYLDASTHIYKSTKPEPRIYKSLPKALKEHFHPYPLLEKSSKHKRDGTGKASGETIHRHLYHRSICLTNSINSTSTKKVDGGVGGVGGNRNDVTTNGSSGEDCQCERVLGKKTGKLSPSSPTYEAVMQAEKYRRDHAQYAVMCETIVLDTKDRVATRIDALDCIVAADSPGSSESLSNQSSESFTSDESDDEVIVVNPISLAQKSSSSSSGFVSMASEPEYTLVEWKTGYNSRSFKRKAQHNYKHISPEVTCSDANAHQWQLFGQYMLLTRSHGITNIKRAHVVYLKMKGKDSYHVEPAANWWWALREDKQDALWASFSRSRSQPKTHTHTNAKPVRANASRWTSTARS